MAEFPVPTNDRDVSYTAAGGETSFATDFPIWAETDVTVIRTRSSVTTTLTLTTDYTVSIAEATGIATITPVGSVVAADTWRLKGTMTVDRTTDYAQRGGWQASLINKDFDRIIAMVQEQVRDLAAAVISSASLPLALLNGGTGASYASAAALRTGLGLVGLSEIRGHIAGLTLSNNGTDATNDIDIAVGSATADDQSAVLVLASALTKRLDATWAVGTNQGMRASGAAITDTTYHIFLIRRPDTGVVDIAADTSASGANIAANTDAAYTQKRRIGSIIRASSAIVAFLQNGDIFRRVVAVDRNNTAAQASALLTLSVPVGIIVQPICRITLQAGVSVEAAVQLGSAARGSADTGVAYVLTGAGDSSDRSDTLVAPVFSSNTSAQIYHSQINSTGTPAASVVATHGWVDRRGRDD